MAFKNKNSLAGKKQKCILNHYKHLLHCQFLFQNELIVFRVFILRIFLTLGQPQKVSGFRTTVIMLQSNLSIKLYMLKIFKSFFHTNPIFKS